MYRDNGYEGIALEFQRDQVQTLQRIEKHLAEMAAALVNIGQIALVAGGKLERLIPEERSFADPITPTNEETLDD